MRQWSKPDAAIIIFFYIIFLAVVVAVVFTGVGCGGVLLLLLLFFDTNQPSLPTPFYSALVSISVFMALSTVFHSINSPDSSLLPHSVLPV